MPISRYSNIISELRHAQSMHSNVCLHFDIEMNPFITYERSVTEIVKPRSYKVVKVPLIKLADTNFFQRVDTTVQTGQNRLDLSTIHF